jgi:hypothetical protein
MAIPENEGLQTQKDGLIEPIHRSSLVRKDVKSIKPM